MIKAFKHKGAHRFFETGSATGIQATHATRLRLQLPAALQTSAEFWLNLQQAFDLWQIRQIGVPKVQRLANRDIPESPALPT